MSRFRLVFFSLLAALSLTACFEDNDDVRVAASTSEINDFIYRAMNRFYLYKADVPQLADDAFDLQSEAYDTFLSASATPEIFFNNLVYQPEDRFSVLVEDYRVLENALNGISLTNGMQFELRQLENGQVFGAVRYVLPNSNADQQNLSRGMLFTRVNGTTLTENNFNQLLNNTSYSIGLASFNQQTESLDDLPESINLTAQEYTENPVHIATTITEGNTKIGYLMYNGFTASFTSDLNAAFADFQAEGIDDLVIDLRYNSGGSIETCNDLGSMITGQFEGALFSLQEYNDNFENEEILFNNAINTGASINSLNLTKVYILASRNSASASELLINSLRPYIDVVHIGEATRGKFQGSTTVYDSPNFSRNNVNIGHRYALQPLILKSVNANGVTDYFDGLQPDITFTETPLNFGTLGDPEEPFLNAAIETILTGGRPAARQKLPASNMLTESGSQLPTYQRMYITPKNMQR